MLWLPLLLLCSAVPEVTGRQVVHLLCISSDSAEFTPDRDYLNFSFRYINNNLSQLFPTFTMQLQVIVADGQKTGSAAKAFIDGYLQPPYKALLLGAAFSHQSQIVADIGRYYYLPQIGFSNTSPLLSDKSAYPFYIRLPVTGSLFVRPTVWLLRRFGWRRVGLITMDFEVVYPTALQLEAALMESNITYQKMIYSNDPTDAIKNLLKSDIRIFVVVRSGNQELPSKRLGCVIKQLGIYGPKYFWLQVGLPFTAQVMAGSCPDSDRADSLEGSIETDTAVMDSALVETRIGPAGKTLPELFSKFINEYPERRADALMKTLFGLDLRFDAVMSAALALNRTLQSWNYSEELQLGNSSFKTALFRNILDLDFIGLSGRVVFDSNGDRTPSVLVYQLRNLTRHLVGIYDPILRTVNWTADFLFAGGSPPVDTPALLIEPLKLGSAGAISVISASSIGIALSVAAVAVNSHYRELRLIKMSSPLVNNVIGAGCLMCYASCIVMAVNSHWSVSVALCWAQTALLTLGYSAAFGAMLAKTWRVYCIFTNVKLRRVAIRDVHLFAVILAVLAADIALLAVWGAVDPLQLLRSSLPALERDDGTVIRYITDECTCSRMNVWIGIELGIKGFLLLIAIFFAWETRAVQVEALNDSKKIGICVYNTTVMGLIGVVILFTLPTWSLELRLILIASSIIVCATTTLMLVFGSKIFMLVKHGPNRVDDQEVAMQATGGVSLEASR